METNGFIDQLYSHGLQPLKTRPTRITRDTKSLIDNIFTTDLNSHKQSGIIINDISDNLPIYVVTQCINKETLNKTCIKKRVINDFTKKTIIKDLENCNWDEILAEEDINFTCNKFVNMFTNLFNTNCPVNTSNITQGKITNKRPDKPWMTSCLKNACKKKKNMLYKQFLKNRTIEREAKYKKYKNKLTAILRYSEKQHYSNMLELNKMNMKETWKILNTVINKKKKGSQYPTQFNDDARKVTGNFILQMDLIAFFPT